MKFKFECPRCGHDHIASQHELTHATYIDSKGHLQTCSFKLLTGRGIVEFFMEIEGEYRKQRFLRVEFDEVSGIADGGRRT